MTGCTAATSRHIVLLLAELRLIPMIEADCSRLVEISPESLKLNEMPHQRDDFVVASSAIAEMVSIKCSVH